LHPLGLFLHFDFQVLKQVFLTLYSPLHHPWQSLVVFIMRFSTAFIALSAPFLVSAAPARFYGKRSEADVLVFKFADVLEQLETQFYQQAIAKFQDSDFIDAGFPDTQIPVEQFVQILDDESTHSVVLQAALRAWGEEPITSCSFNFDSVLGDVATMAATARVVENVGVAAYLGAASLLTDPLLLTAAGSILTVEARHQTILNVLSGTGTAIPSAFDIALTPSEVLALATPFFSGPCDLGVPANPVLSLTNTGLVGPGTLLTFSADGLNGSTEGFHCQMLIGGAQATLAFPIEQCVVPEINGPVALWITSDGQPLINNVRDRATTQLIAGPTFAFIDIQPEVLGSLARSGADLPDIQESTSTRTISPDEASSIIAGIGIQTQAVGDDSAATTTDSAFIASATDSATTSTAADASSTDVPDSANSANLEAAPAPGTPGGPSDFTGLSPDGAVTVNGWTNV
jgi:hypothetical protein